MKVLCVVGARPNLMKVAPLVEEMRRYPEVDAFLAHTGQHYDHAMSKVFFDDLKLPRPDVDLEVGSGSHAWQTAQIMLRLEPVLEEYGPDLVIVVGDVNSTLAAAIVATKMRIALAHVEAGLRSFDPEMPEEVNRRLVDAVSDLLFTTSRDADTNLINEGVPAERIFFSGNVMVDTLLRFKDLAAGSGIRRRLHLTDRPYGFMTLHRPSNVDAVEVLEGIVEALCAIGATLPIVFPVHPRTRQRLSEHRLDGKLSRHGILLTEPLGYVDSLHLMMNAKAVLTDSGGIQEETSVLGVPCLTLRQNTERPVTVTEGTNIVVGTEPERIVAGVRAIMDGEGKVGRIPELWDGKAASRIMQVIARAFGLKAAEAAAGVMSSTDKKTDTS